ncbi:hypothetical protein BD408DRAFT_86764 [Parasitella parasitica]|nr:hypothetical protein BD408DRAFT_86764 [Parasitella parasitica]
MSTRAHEYINASPLILRYSSSLRQQQAIPYRNIDTSNQISAIFLGNTVFLSLFTHSTVKEPMLTACLYLFVSCIYSRIYRRLLQNDSRKKKKKKKKS